MEAIGTTLKCNELSLKFVGCVIQWLGTGIFYINVIRSVPDDVACLRNMNSSTSRRVVSFESTSEG